MILLVGTYGMYQAGRRDRSTFRKLALSLRAKERKREREREPRRPSQKSKAKLRCAFACILNFLQNVFVLSKENVVIEAEETF